MHSLNCIYLIVYLIGRHLNFYLVSNTRNTLYGLTILINNIFFTRKVYRICIMKLWHVLNCIGIIVCQAILSIVLYYVYCCNTSLYIN